MLRRLWARGSNKDKRKLNEANNSETAQNRTKQRWEAVHAQPKGGNPLWGAVEKLVGLPLNIGAMFTAQPKRPVESLSRKLLLQMVVLMPVLLQL